MRNILYLVFFVILTQVSFADKEGGMSENKKIIKKAVFAGGCFWCMEAPFKVIDGVMSVLPGYTGGHTKNPTYEEVCSGTTGHAEAVEVTYDASKVDYNALLDIFWRNIDPTTMDQQFADAGTQYRTAIFYQDEEQRQMAEKSKAVLADSGRYDGPIVTEITPAGEFYPAEDYHREYYKKHPTHYQLYRIGSGRDQYLDRTWKNDTKYQELKKKKEEGKK